VKRLAHFKFFCAILLGLLSNGVFANTNMPSSALPQLIQEAMQNNPQIKSAHDRWMAMQYAIPQAKSLPDPTIDLSHMQMTGNAEMNDNPQHVEMIGLSQAVPFPGKLIKKGRIASLDAKRMQAEYQATQLTVVADLKKLFYELYFTNKSIQIYKKNQLLLEKIEKSAQTNYSVGKIPQQDIFRAQTEISRLLMRLVMLRQERVSLESDINRILNRSLDTVITTPSTLSITSPRYNLSYFNSLIDRQSPQLIMQKRNVEKGSESVSLSKMDYVPDVDVSAGELHDNVMHTEGYQVMANITLPLYFFSKQNKGVRESEANYNADIENLYSTHRDLLFQTKNDLLQIKRSSQLIRLIQHTIIPQATLTFQSSQANYGVGKVDFLTLLNNLLMLQENELELQNETVQHEKAIARLEEITGILL